LQTRGPERRSGASVSASLRRDELARREGGMGAVRVGAGGLFTDHGSIKIKIKIRIKIKIKIKIRIKRKRKITNESRISRTKTIMMGS
jgi:hypothetical protein